MRRLALCRQVLLVPLIAILLAPGSTPAADDDLAPEFSRQVPDMMDVWEAAEGDDESYIGSRSPAEDARRDAYESESDTPAEDETWVGRGGDEDEEDLEYGEILDAPGEAPLSPVDAALEEAPADDTWVGGAEGEEPAEATSKAKRDDDDAPIHYGRSPTRPVSRSGVPITAAPDPSSLRTWSDYSKAGRQAMRRNDLQAAENYYWNALARAESPSGSRTAVETVLSNLKRLADAVYDSGDSEHYLDLSERILAAEVRLLSAEDPTIHRKMGKLYRQLGRVDEAAERLERSLELLDAERRPNAEALVETLLALGILRANQERDEEAEAHFQRARQIAESKNPANRLTANTLNELAWFYVARGRYQEATPIARRAVDIMRDSRATRADQAIMVDTLAMALLEQGESAEALRLYRNVLRESADATTKRRIEPKQVQLYQHFAEALRATGNDEEARQVDRRIGAAASLAAAEEERVKEARAKARANMRFDHLEDAEDEEALSPDEDDEALDSSAALAP